VTAPSFFEKSKRILMLTLVSGAIGACPQQVDTGLSKRLDDATTEVVKLKGEKTALTDEVAGLKRQLVAALADPSTFRLRDPEIIELIAEARGVPSSSVGQIGDELKIGKGDLDPATASKIVMAGARALQQCYERALKKNAALQYQAGVQMALGLTVAPTGSVAGVTVKPNIDSSLTECIDGAAKRWKFPKFAGTPVTIEQKVMLTPKT
jgi:hypothetical protein